LVSRYFRSHGTVFALVLLTPMIAAAQRNTTIQFTEESSVGQPVVLSGSASSIDDSTMPPDALDVSIIAQTF